MARPEGVWRRWGRGLSAVLEDGLGWRGIEGMMGWVVLGCCEEEELGIGIVGG